MDKARIIMEISSDILRVMKAVMNSELGINAKVGVNTLVGSNLEREASVETDGDFIYHLYLNDYVTYVNSGRKAGKKFPLLLQLLHGLKEEAYQQTIQPYS